MTKPSQSILIHSLTYTRFFSTSSPNLFISDSIDPPHSTDIPQANYVYSIIYQSHTYLSEYLRWFGYIERIEDVRLVRKVYG